MLIVAWPAKKWIFVPHAGVILDMANQGKSEDEIRRHVVTELIKGADRNAEMLKFRQDAFRVAVVLLIGEIVLLIGALAVN